MTDDDQKWIKLFKYLAAMEQRIRDELTSETRGLKMQFTQMQNTLDGLLKSRETDDQERAAMNVQLDRHDSWIGQLASETGTELLDI